MVKYNVAQYGKDRDGKYVIPLYPLVGDRANVATTEGVHKKLKCSVSN